MSYAMMVKESVKQYPELKIIDAHKLYKENFNNISERAFYQTFSRMTQSGELKRLTKGVYCKPKKGRFGNIISSEKDILEYYLGPNKSKGVVIGYRMYNKYKLTSQISKSVEIYSNITLQKKKNIKSVKISKVDICLDQATIRLIEMLEVLQNYKSIEDLNQLRLIEFIEDSIEYYDHHILNQLVNRIGYKKSTLASLKNILDYYKVDNLINEYLNETSKYNTIRMERIIETTS